MWVYDSFIDRTPSTAVVVRQSVTLTIHDDGFSGVDLLVAEDGRQDAPATLAFTQTGDRWQATWTAPQVGVWWYRLRLHRGDDTALYGPPAETPEGEGTTQSPGWYQLTVVRWLESVPTWYQTARVYHIFVDRFNNGNQDGHVNAPKPNSFIYGQHSDLPFYVKDEKGGIARWDFYGGNLAGITAKLDLLRQRGINALYLSPIFQARSNHRYDTGDYRLIDPMLGDLGDFNALVAGLHVRGMHLLLDGVFNHVGDDSRYFNAFGHYPALGATDSPASPYYDWFTFTDYPHGYDSWWGVQDLPAIKKDSQAFHDFIAGQPDSVINTWTALGVDGWRLDVADELSMDFLAQIRSALDSFNDQVLIGEVWEDASTKIAYGQRRPYFMGGYLQAVMNYPLRTALLDFALGKLNSTQLLQLLLTQRGHYPPSSFAFNFNNVGSHDTPRVLTALGEDLAKFRVVFDLLYLLPGTPVLYYGDEAGLTGGKDPGNRAFYPWGQENQRTLAIVTEALAWRRDWPALRGDAEFWPFTFGAGFGFIRRGGSQQVLVLVNPQGTPLAASQALNLRYVPAALRHQLHDIPPLAPYAIRVTPT